MIRQVAVIVLGAASLFPLQAAIDAGRDPDREATVLVTLPPARIVPALAFGHREPETMADLLEIRAINFIHRRFERDRRAERDQLMRLYGAIIALDPNDPNACWRGAVYLYALADRPDAALELLELGMDPETGVHAEHPHRWKLFLEAAGIHLVGYAQDRDRDAESRTAMVRKAGEYLVAAGGLPGCPSGLERIGRSYLSRGLSVLDGLRYEERMWEQRAATRDALLRGRAEQRLAESRCAIQREKLQQALVAFEAARGAPPERLELLGLDLTDPLGVGFWLDPSGRVVAPAHEAALLTRRLNESLARWRRNNEDAETPPTAATLGLSADETPAYLEVRSISVREVQVRGRLPE